MLPPHTTHRARPKAKAIVPVLRLADVAAPGVPTLADRPLAKRLVSRPLPRAGKPAPRVLKAKDAVDAIR